MAEVDQINFNEKRVECLVEATKQRISLDYDHLVISVGTVTRMPPLPGLAEHALTLNSLGDAIQIRDHAIRMLEAADASESEAERRELLSFVVVGANFTGVEVVGDYWQYLNEARHEYPRIKKTDLSMTLLEMAPRILGALDEDLSVFAERHLTRRGVRVMTNTTATRIDANKIVLASGEEIASRTVIWCAGIQPNPLIAKLKGLPLDERGYIETNLHTDVPGLDKVWAVGDAAVNKSKDGHVYPATAQHAVQLGRALAKIIAADLRGAPEKNRLAGEFYGT